MHSTKEGFSIRILKAILVTPKTAGIKIILRVEAKACKSKYVLKHIKICEYT